MHQPTAIIAGLFAAVAFSSPIAQPSGANTYLSAHTLENCEKAENCETYDDPKWGTRIRFREGMEPGSEHYKRNVQPNITAGNTDGIYARASTNTHTTISDNKINYGRTKASGVGGVIHHLYDICHEGSCDTNPFNVKSHYAGDTNEYDRDVILNAHGQYDGWDERDLFVEIIVATAGVNEKCEDKTWMHGEPGWVASGSVNMCEQANYFGFNRFVDGNLQGFMEVRAELEDFGSGACEGIMAALGSMSSVLGLIPGGAIPGGVAAAFFGSMSNPLCK